MVMLVGVKTERKGWTRPRSSRSRPCCRCCRPPSAWPCRRRSAAAAIQCDAETTTASGTTSTFRWATARTAGSSRQQWGTQRSSRQQRGTGGFLHSSGGQRGLLHGNGGPRGRLEDGGRASSKSDLLEDAGEQLVDAVVQYRRHVDVLGRVRVRQRAALWRMKTQQSRYNKCVVVRRWG